MEDSERDSQQLPFKRENVLEQEIPILNYIIGLRVKFEVLYLMNEVKHLLLRTQKLAHTQIKVSANSHRIISRLIFRANEVGTQCWK